MKATMDRSGRVMVPASLRRAMALDPGDRFTVHRGRSPSTTWPPPPGDTADTSVLIAMLWPVDCGVVGGAVYDAFIAATVQEAGARLVTLDHRAAPTYAAIGVGFELLQR